MVKQVEQEAIEEQLAEQALNKYIGRQNFRITSYYGNCRQCEKNPGILYKNFGVRLVKKTVNFDDPGTYHFYFGDGIGTPGGILTFFPWKGIRQGSMGTGMATEIGYSVSSDSLGFWAGSLLLSAPRKT